MTNGVTHLPAYKQRLPRQILRRLAYVFVIGLTAGSFLSGSIKLLLGTQPYDAATGQVGLQHRIFHFVSVGITTLDLLLLAEQLKDEIKACAFMFVLCALIEITQHVIGYSVVFEWWDLRDDCYALVGAFVLVQLANMFDASRIK